MSQSRIIAITEEPLARKVAGLLGAEFGDVGLPVAAYESDEIPNQWEVSIYCETNIASEISDQIISLLSDNSIDLSFKTELLPDVDWVATTLQQLAPVRAGRFIVHGSHDAREPKPHEIAVKIDASVAFGTGHHGTTAGCLDMLDHVLKRSNFENVLDLGTGSGVLAIASAKAGCQVVVASDIDPISTETARFNSRENSVANRIHCITASGFNHPDLAANAPFDLVIANILARPLQSLAPKLVQATSPGGTIILSGLLPQQKALIIASYRLQGAVFEHAHIRDGWLSLLLRKP